MGGGGSKGGRRRSCFTSRRTFFSIVVMSFLLRPMTMSIVDECGLISGRALR